MSDEDDEAEVKQKRVPESETAASKHADTHEAAEAQKSSGEDGSASEAEDGDEIEEEQPEAAAKARSTVQTTLTNQKDPYPDWKSGDPVPYAALCTTFSLIEMTTKRLQIMAHCSLFLRQVLRLTPGDLLPTIQLMINKLAADYEGIELGIGESLIMKAIGESTGRSLATVKADQKEIGDLGLVAAKSRAKQKLMFKPKSLTVRGVLQSLLSIATTEGSGSQGRKVDGIKKLMSAADIGVSNIDISTNKGGPSEAKFIIRFLEGKLRLGLAERTVIVSLAQAVVVHEAEKQGEKPPSAEKIAQGEAILKGVYRLVVTMWLRT
jgi:DNA ligase 1